MLTFWSSELNHKALYTRVAPGRPPDGRGVLVGSEYQITLRGYAQAQYTPKIIFKGQAIYHGAKSSCWLTSFLAPGYMLANLEK